MNRIQGWFAISSCQNKQAYLMQKKKKLRTVVSYYSLPLPTYLTSSKSVCAEVIDVFVATSHAHSAAFNTIAVPFAAITTALAAAARAAVAILAVLALTARRTKLEPKQEHDEQSRPVEVPDARGSG
jgi:hypothetical protein